MHTSGPVVALCGGIGGAKLALGLARILPPERLTIIVNTGDDFDHFGLRVCPDIDTVTYTLAGCANPDTGWGRSNESWRFMQTVSELGGETWFRLGDTDLATSAIRTARLNLGERLTQITRSIARALNIGPAILPVSDDPISTTVETTVGALPFQRYFVERRCEPEVLGLRYEGAPNARPTDAVISALAAKELAAVILCPSNPYLSIDPMLAIPGFRDLLRKSAAPIIAVSPIVGSKAIKGPLAKIMRELKLEVSARAIAEHYRGLIDAFVVDQVDQPLHLEGVRTLSAHTVMNDLPEKELLARTVVDFAAVLQKESA